MEGFFSSSSLYFFLITLPDKWPEDCTAGSAESPPCGRESCDDLIVTQRQRESHVTVNSWITFLGAAAAAAATISKSLVSSLFVSCIYDEGSNASSHPNRVGRWRDGGGGQGGYRELFLQGPGVLQRKPEREDIFQALFVFLDINRSDSRQLWKTRAAREMMKPPPTLKRERESRKKRRHVIIRTWRIPYIVQAHTLPGISYREVSVASYFFSLFCVAPTYPKLRQLSNGSIICRAKEERAPRVILLAAIIKSKSRGIQQRAGPSCGKM